MKNINKNIIALGSLIISYVKDKGHGKTFCFHKMIDIGGELSY